MCLEAPMEQTQHTAWAFDCSHKAHHGLASRAAITTGSATRRYFNLNKHTFASPKASRANVARKAHNRHGLRERAWAESSLADYPLSDTSTTYKNVFLSPINQQQNKH